MITFQDPVSSLAKTLLVYALPSWLTPTLPPFAMTILPITPNSRCALSVSAQESHCLATRHLNSTTTPVISTRASESISSSPPDISDFWICSPDPELNSKGYETMCTVWARDHPDPQIEDRVLAAFYESGPERFDEEARTGGFAETEIGRR